MSKRSLARSTMLVAALATALACGEDPQSPSSDGAGVNAPNSPAAAVTTAATYSVKDLGTLGTDAVANGINDQGGVVGSSWLTNGRQHAFLWRAGKMSDLGALAGGTSEANDINNSDVVVGWSTTANGAQRAVRWQDGKKLNLGTLGGRNSVAYAINDLGVIVGSSETRTGKTHAFVWQNGTMRDLGTVGGDYAVALDINRSGKIVGGSNGHAVTWKDGVIKDLGTNGHDGSVATAINTKGQIAGTLGPYPDAEGEELEFTYPFIFYQDSWSRLAPQNGPTNEVHAINRDGLVAGSWVDYYDEFGRGIAWVAGPDTFNVLVLPSLTPGGKPRNSANDINSFGTIVGSSLDQDSGPEHAVLWRHL